jgi:hypothetical protein
MDPNCLVTLSTTECGRNHMISLHCPCLVRLFIQKDDSSTQAENTGWFVAAIVMKVGHSQLLRRLIANELNVSVLREA